MKIASPNAKKRARIEIIPLIDIVFFLLATFVMVSMSMVQNQGVQVNLPVAQSSQAHAKDDLIVISIDENGVVYLNKEALSLTHLSARLSQIKSDNPEIKVIINGDKDALFGQAVLVLDEVKKSGISKVAIRTKAS